MQLENGLEIGKIYEGKVRSITSYGAFVEVPVGEGRPVTGMVHISEVANTYVSDIHDFLEEGQTVQVKVLAVNEQGKISMSVKKALPDDGRQTRAPRGSNPRQGDRPQRTGAPQGDRPRRPAQKPQKPNVWEPKPQKPESEMTFEDMMSRFKQNSEERISDIRRNTDRKNGGRRRSK